MKKWIFLIMFFALGTVFFLVWSDQNKTKYIGEIVSSIPSVDLIIVKESETDKQILEFTNENPFFFDMANIFEQFYSELKQSEKDFLNKDSAYVIEYLKDNTILYKVNLYKVEEDHANLFAGKSFTTEIREVNYLYTPKNTNLSYVFVLERYHHLLGMNDGLEEIINEILALQK